MPIVYEEDNDIIQVPESPDDIACIGDDYRRLIAAKNTPIDIRGIKRPVSGRMNYLDKLRGKRKQLTIAGVRTRFIDYDRYNRFQKYRMLKNASETMKRSNVRCHVGKRALLSILAEQMAGRLANYNGTFMGKQKILCIIGESGVGKTLASLHLQNKLGANVICSFTTRPPRKTEVEGREHHFVDIVPPPEELLAFVRFGLYIYYATVSQVHGDCTVYVIDEKGLLDIRERWGDRYDITTVYITRRRLLRTRRGVEGGRMDRDRFRMKLDLDSYDYVVENNSTKRAFFEKIEEIYNTVKNK